MFANLLHLLSHRARSGDDPGFVREVRVAPKSPRSRRMELLIWICWVLIGIKSVVVVWAVRHYHIPFSPLWVILPTIAFAALCTAVYFWRNWGT